jgi:hypothetical protein
MSLSSWVGDAGVGLVIVVGADMDIGGSLGLGEPAHAYIATMGMKTTA